MNDKTELNKVFAAVLDDFESGYMAARNLAPRTRIDYRSDALQFLEHLQESNVLDLGRVAPKHISAFLSSLDRRKLAGSTRRRKFIVVRTLFRWLVSSDDEITSNPALHIKPPLAEQKEARHLNKKEYRRLLSVIQKPRDRAMIQLLLQTGLRLSELQRLTLFDLDLPDRIYKTRPEFSAGTAQIHGKGRREREVSINYIAVEALNEWLRVRPDLETDAVFVSNRRTPLSSRQIQRIIHRYMKEAKIKNASVHSLRHTMATSMLDGGAPVKEVSETLGHSTTDMTIKTYQHDSRRRRAEVMTQHALK